MIKTADFDIQAAVLITTKLLGPADSYFFSVFFMKKSYFFHKIL